ncbi:MAG: histidinol dehydrogenase [Leptonema sp. (in: bacteria)]
MQIYYYKDLTSEQIQKLCKRPSFEDPEALETVKKIYLEIKEGGKEALFNITKHLDGYLPEPLVISKEEFSKAEKLLTESEKLAFQKAYRNIEAFHKFQYQNLKPAKTIIEETTLGYFYRPIERAGIYVPGGNALYPSSVLMGVVPAKIAGVEYVIVITPANKEGEIHPSVLYCANLAGADGILKVGGAHGIFAGFLGIGVKPLEILVGPGNRYVTAAKTLLSATGKVKIDQPAGPSEVLILADLSANPKFIASDLLSQAEHGSDSIGVLLTDSLVLAENVINEIQTALKTRTRRLEFKQKSILENSYILIFDSFTKEENGKLIETKSLRDAFHFINEFAPEHLEICMNLYEDLEDYLKYIQSAGSIFIGRYAPVALGDYYSGANHILPTGGSAKIFSGLGVETFLKKITWQYTTKEGLRKALEPIKIMSKIEGLDEEHGNSVEVRFE